MLLLISYNKIETFIKNRLILDSKMEPKPQYKDGQKIEPWQPGYNLIEGENFESLVKGQRDLNELYASGDLVRLGKETESPLLGEPLVVDLATPIEEDHLVDLLLREYSPCPSTAVA